MAKTLFKPVSFELSQLLGDIELGKLALPELQRPFVWQKSEVRDLVDSMYRGFPVGYLMLWNAAEVDSRFIGIDGKQHTPTEFIVDGQQRLTSLYAVMKGATVTFKDFTTGRINLSFRPRDGLFEVTDPTIERDPEFLADITRLWTGEDWEVIEEFLEQLRSAPHNLAQRAEIIVEHFREHTMKKIGGQAKAMVVTSSRLHAVRTKLAIDAYVAEKGYSDVHALVAFSGKVVDEGDEFTEPGMNRFPESETAQRFASDDYQVLVVAEKFQTGFDQPLLHTMYVDKVLTGLNAVQTLSRLNRILPPAKTDTFVLDFRNELEGIQDAFRPYYERTDAVPTDPNLLYDTHRALWDFDVLREDEVEAGVQALLAVTETSGHGAVYAALDSARDRFGELDEEVQDAFRDVLTRFTNLYAFVSQIVSYVDRGLERDYLYGRALLAYLPGRLPSDSTSAPRSK